MEDKKLMEVISDSLYLGSEISKSHNRFYKIDKNLSNLDSTDLAGLKVGGGIYIISVDTTKTSGCLLDCLKDNKNTNNVIYIGRSGNLKERLKKVILGHDIGGGPSIFFRKLGSFLGYRCSKGRCKIENKYTPNYEFNNKDLTAINKWTFQNLRVKAFYTDQSYFKDIYREKVLIKYFKPPFNKQHSIVCNEVESKHLANLTLWKKYYNDR